MNERTIERLQGEAFARHWREHRCYERLGGYGAYLDGTAALPAIGHMPFPEFIPLERVEG